MTREQLEHILRAASAIAGEPDVLVIGSQSMLGSFTEDDLPPEATTSMEADIAFFDDPADAKADQVDGAIGADRVVGSAGKRAASLRDDHLRG
jgi:hypothetical protein